MVIFLSVQPFFMEAGKNSGEPSPGSQEKSPGSPHHEVFSASHASHLDSRFRRFLYRPDRLAERWIQPGNLVLDFGCGPGFFTREFAKRTGDTGTVFAVDLQQKCWGSSEKNLNQKG